MPSRRSTSPSASPSGAGSRARTRSRAARRAPTSPPRRRTACAISTPTGPAAEHEQPARDGLHAGRLAVGPDAVELAQPRDRRDDRVGAARDDDVVGGVAHAVDLDRARARRAGRCRAAARCPRPSSQRSWPGVGVVGDHEVALRERRLDVDLGGAPPPRARRAPPRPAAAASWTGCTPSTSTRRRPAPARRPRPAARRRPARRRSARRASRRPDDDVVVVAHDRRPARARFQPWKCDRSPASQRLAQPGRAEVPVGADLAADGPQVVPQVGERGAPPEPVAVVDAVDRRARA